MNQLPEEIELQFFRAIKGNVSIAEFEQWVYATPELERHLSAEDYLELITFNYKPNYAKYDFYPMLEKHVDMGRYEFYRIRTYLNDILKKDSEYPRLVANSYDEYCDGYGFFDGLAFGYGLPFQERYYNDVQWAVKPSVENQFVIEQSYPEVEEEVRQI